MVRAKIHQAVIFPEVESGNNLDAHQGADARLNGFYKRSSDIQVAVSVIAGVEVNKSYARFGLRRARHFHHVLKFLFRFLVYAHVEPGGAELAVKTGRVMPESAGI